MGILKKDNKKKPSEEKQAPKKEEESSSEEGNESQPDDSENAVARLVAEAVAVSNKFTHRMLIICVSFVVVLISSYGFMAWQTSGKVSSLNDNIQATLETVKELNLTITNLSTKQGEFKNQQSLLGEAVAKAEGSVIEMQEKLPNAAAQKVKLETDKVVFKIQDLEQALKDQGSDLGRVSGVVSTLGSQLKNFENRLSNIQQLSDDVESLVILEKENYLQVLERQADLQEKQSDLNPINVPRDPNMVFYSISSE